MKQAVAAVGLNPNELHQGSFFTRAGKRAVPSRGSYANVQQLLKLLFIMEQGELVDAFSSREIKRLLYSSQARIRYASSPTLDESAVYHKSGSLYRCRPQAGYQCRKYEGNLLNQLSSIVIVESPAYKPRLRYMIAVSSNVLRQNSDAAHRRLAAKVHRLMQEHYDAQ